VSRKIGLGIDVLTSARQRIAFVFDRFERVYISFSGGKDSTVLLQLAAAEAQRRGRKVGCLFVDLEAQYKMTIEHVHNSFARHAGAIEPFWLALPLTLRNAVSQYQPKWMCWDPEAREFWVRNPDPLSIADPARFPWFRPGMEFEELVPSFGRWYANGKLTACLVGIRADESLNRFRTLIMDKTRFEGRTWTTWLGEGLYNAYPIYDWRTEDIWTWHAKTGEPYNRLYDLMHRAGLSIHRQRICQPYGDDQRRGLWLYHLIEPENWGRVVARVNGANTGALYVRETGNILGNIRIARPPGHTWESFARLILISLPEPTRTHYEDKIAVFLRWWEQHDYPKSIPDEADPKEEALRRQPSWRRICKALLKNDYWCKGLSFGQQKSDAYEKYRKIMKKRRAMWGTI
jgi:predicted phosphoadenosine phosphosulfate sulfurtransferase